MAKGTSAAEPKVGATEKLGAAPSVEPGEDVRQALRFIDHFRDVIAQEVDTKVRASVDDGVFLRLADRLQKEKIVEGLVDQEVSKRSRSLFAILGGAAILLGFVGFQSIQPLVRSQAQEASQAAVDDELEKYQTDLDKLRTAAQEERLQLISERVKAQGEFRDTATSIVTRALQDIDDAIDGAEKKLETDRERATEQMTLAAGAAVEQVENRRTQSVERIESVREAAIRDIGELQARAEKDLAQLRDDALQRVEAKRLASAGVSEPGGLSDRLVEGGDDAESAVVEAIVLLADRDYDGIVSRSRALLDQGLYEAAVPVLNPVLMRPVAFPPEERIQAAEIILSQSASTSRRAQYVDELLVAAVRGADQAMYDLAMAEYEANALARLTQGPFEELMIAVHEGQSAARVSRLAEDAATGEGILGMGLINTLSIAKKGGADDDVVEKIERRLINNLRTTNTVDRPTDYPLAWLLMTTLMAEPRFDAAGIKEVSQRVRRYVLSGPEASADPWELAKVLDEADAMP